MKDYNDLDLTEDDVKIVIRKSVKEMSKLQVENFVFDLLAKLNPELPYSDLIKAIEESTRYVY